MRKLTKRKQGFKKHNLKKHSLKKHSLKKHSLKKKLNKRNKNVSKRNKNVNKRKNFSKRKNFNKRKNKLVNNRTRKYFGGMDLVKMHETVEPQKLAYLSRLPDLITRNIQKKNRILLNPTTIMETPKKAVTEKAIAEEEEARVKAEKEAKAKAEEAEEAKAKAEEAEEAEEAEAKAVEEEKARLAAQEKATQKDFDDAVKSHDIPTIVKFVKSGTDEQKEKAADALQNLAANNADNKITIKNAGGIEPLVALVMSGTNEQKEVAAGALQNLLYAEENHSPLIKATNYIIRKYATKSNDIVTIIEFIKLIEIGNGEYVAPKTNVDYTLIDLITQKYNEITPEDKKQSINMLVELVNSGTDVQKTIAAAGLAAFIVPEGPITEVERTTHKKNIREAGGINSLVTLLKPRATKYQKENAALALYCLSEDETNSIAIKNAGGIEPLVALLSGTNEQKEVAAAALYNLAQYIDIKKKIEDAGYKI